MEKLKKYGRRVLEVLIIGLASMGVFTIPVFSIAKTSEVKFLDAEFKRKDMQRAYEDLKLEKEILQRTLTECLGFAREQ